MKYLVACEQSKQLDKMGSFFAFIRFYMEVTNGNVLCDK